MESSHPREPWNKGKLIRQKPPLKPKDIWAIRIQLQNARQVRDLAMFNLAIDSKLRGCDLVNLRVRDITCVFHAIWTRIPWQTGHAFHANLDSRSVATRG